MRKYLDYLNGLLVVVMFLTIFIQIVARLFLQVPTSWSVETSIILFVFVVFLGIATLTRERNHLRVDAFYNALPRKGQQALDVVCGIIYIIFFCAFALGCYRNILDNWAVEIPTIEWFRWGYVYLFVLAATAIHIGYLVVNLFEDIAGLVKKA